MQEPIDIAFYAPMKSADHPIPSGDRTMARLFIRTLQKAGFHPTIPTTLRSFDAKGDPSHQMSLRDAALKEADQIIDKLASSEKRPRLWFSYHVYYKSPDWIGPIVAKALTIPYVIAEGSRAPKRANGPWALGHAGAEQALDQANLILSMTPVDARALEAQRPLCQHILDFPPFIDLEDWPMPERSQKNDQQPTRYLTVAMMREGDKFLSYQQLALTLQAIPQPWRLDIVGDGPARPAVEALFKPFGTAICWHGEVTDKERMAQLYSEADMLLWPAVNEAYGMVFLEAQAYGCPVIAGNHGGVASVIHPGVTGLLVEKNNIFAFKEAIELLSGAPTLRDRLAQAARKFVHTERNLANAADRLRANLLPLVHQERI